MVVGLTSTQAAILHELLNTKHPVTADMIGKRVNKSSGVVRYNIASINHWLKPNFGTIISRPKVGYMLEITDLSYASLRDALDKMSVQPVYSPNDRRQLLSINLLCSFDYQSTSKLAKMVLLSKTTLTRELRMVETWLNGHQLYLQKRPRLGTKVVGREIDIRHALVLLILEVVPESILMKLLQWGIQENIAQTVFLHPVQVYILERLQTWDLQATMRFVSHVEKDLSLKLGDSRFLYLILYWVISIFRVKGGQVVSIPEEALDTLLNLKEMEQLEISVDNYARETGIRLPESEPVFFLLEVLSSPHGTDQNIQDVREFGKLEDLQATDLANLLVDQVAIKTGYRIFNQEILKRMTFHLSKMLFRLKYNLPIVNPYAHEVIRSYPEMWNATLEAVKTFKPDMGMLSHEEVAFLTMFMILAKELDHKEGFRVAPKVIVVCPTGGVSVWMLVSRLKTEMPDIQVIATISLREMNNVDKGNVDAIITTARNIKEKNLPVIYVSPFLSEEDISTIQIELRSLGFRL